MAEVTTTISLDADVKTQAVVLLNSFGMAISTAVGVLLTQNIRERRTSFEIRKIPNAEALEALKKLPTMSVTLKNAKKYATFKEALGDILSDV